MADDLLKVGLQKDGQENTPQMVDEKVAKEIQKLKDRINTLIAEGNLEEIRRICAA